MVPLRAVGPFPADPDPWEPSEWGVCLPSRDACSMGEDLPVAMEEKGEEKLDRLGRGIMPKPVMPNDDIWWRCADIKPGSACIKGEGGMNPVGEF